MGKHDLPAFLRGRVEEFAYQRWLHRKAAAHVKRDRKRGRSSATGSAYRDQIHSAVLRCGGQDAYTGEELAWHLISTYSNDEAEEGRHAYKAEFALLPTVDHVEAAVHGTEFAICAWRTNDAKNDLSVESFIDLCAKVLNHAGYRVERGEPVASRRTAT